MILGLKLRNQSTTNSADFVYKNMFEFINRNNVF